MTDENRSSGAVSLEGQQPRKIELTFGGAEADPSAEAGQSAADGQNGSPAEAVPAAMTAEELMAAASKAPEAVREAPQAEPKAAASEGAPAGSAIREHVADAIRDTEVILSPEEQKMVDAFAEKIDITNGAAIMQYGAGTQKKMSEFSDTALANVRNKDMGEVGKQISGLVSELQSFDVTKEENGFLRFFKKSANKVTALQAKYDKTEDSVKAISDALEKHQIQLMKDVATLDRMYALNLSYFKELTMYIAAGKKKLAEVRGGELLKLEEKAKMSQDAQDAQAAKDLAA
ncbi:MAG: toxic anion resistance protein, partial [Lachnospiraceae bacterium]|nr:toxic anion resistance protein [Lachnospiraceae bacterium]